jgi:hypothetical protein
LRMDGSINTEMDALQYGQPKKCSICSNDMIGGLQARNENLILLF